VDPTVVAVPGYFATMGAEAAWLRRRAAREGPSPADYERRDTLTSLTMGVGSLVAPLVVPRLLRPLTPGRGRLGKALVVGAVAAAGVTTVADLVARALRDADAVPGGPDDERPAPAMAGREGRATRRTGVVGGRRRRAVRRGAQRVAAVGGVATVVAGGVALTTTWASRTSPDRLWSRRVLPDLGTGPAAVVAAMVGWDFIYYWNHRIMHECRALWAIHVVHHSSERYNLSTALRQPVADAFGVFVPYGVLCLLGVRPSLVVQARGWNLLYQYWIHTDTIRRLGAAEEMLNTPSLHRVHHGSNQQYLDRNHGGILIVWDRLFGTHEPEDEPVVYGLTENIDTFNPARVATHEHASMLRDVARSTTWRDRLSFVLRGPGWATSRRRAIEVATVAARPVEHAVP
jgi:sterol desaturase/sphingolipid hydroxylase (fatty acid hydroxylase superfamily)